MAAKTNNAFPPVTVEFSGKQYTIESNRVWGLIGAIEEHITYVRLANLMLKNEVPRVKICEAMAAVLRYAGARVSAEDVSRACDIAGLIDTAAQLATILQVAEAPAKEADTGNAATPAKGEAPL